MSSGHLYLAVVFAILLLAFGSSEVYGKAHIEADQEDKRISNLLEDEVIDLHVGVQGSVGRKGVLSKSNKNPLRGKEVKKSNTHSFRDDENCGRVPLFEELYAKSINQTDYKSRGELEDRGEHRILYGANSVPGEWPWLAKVKIFGPEGERDCTGSLLNNRWIITAAHCIGNATRAEATLGLTDLVVRDKSAITIECEKIIKHANATKTHNDIALLRLNISVKYDNFIMPICLASGSDMKSALEQREARQLCHSIGFGLDENMGLPSKLQKLEIKEASCDRLAEDVEHELPDVICALPRAANKGGTCQGDSGGPNVCYNPEANRWNLVGLTSFGPTDCNRDESDPDGWLTGSMDLKKYRKWVALTIEKHG